MSRTALKVWRWEGLEVGRFGGGKVGRWEGWKVWKVGRFEPAWLLSYAGSRGLEFWRFESDIV